MTTRQPIYKSLYFQVIVAIAIGILLASGQIRHHGKGTLAAIGELVVQDEEVADAFEFIDRDPVVFLGHHGIEIAVREQRQQL